MSSQINSSFDEVRFCALLEEAVEKVKNEEDPVVLTEMKKLFKKKVPFTLRMYVAAYLAKQEAFGQKVSFRSPVRRNQPQKMPEHIPLRDKKRPGTPELNASGGERHSPRRVMIDESVAATLFISIGRNRRVFPRDLVGLLIQVAGIDRERIGDIRTLENYSFVQVFKDDAETIIAALNGYEYRGRNLSVSYSRKKDDAELEQDAVESTVDSCAETSVPEPDADETAVLPVTGSME